MKLNALGGLSSCTAVTGLVLVVGAAPAAGAPPEKVPGKHLEFEHFVEHEEFTSPGGEDFGCELPFDVHFVHEARGTFRFTPRGRDGLAYGNLTVRGSDTFSANGHVFRVHFSVHDGDHKVVDEGETLLITGQGAGSTRVHVDGRLTLRDSGMLRYQFRVDHNGTPSIPDDDEVVEELGVIKGSTGLNELEGRDLCEDLETFLSP